MKIRPVGAELFREDRRTDKMKVIISFISYVKAPVETRVTKNSDWPITPPMCCLIILTDSLGECCQRYAMKLLIFVGDMLISVIALKSFYCCLLGLFNS